MATKENTSTSTLTDDANQQLREIADRLESSMSAELQTIANDLHKWAALLNGVSEIARHEPGDNEAGDCYHVAAFTCDTINSDLCRIAARLDTMATEGSGS